MAYRDDLQAALARAEAAEHRLDSRCAAHPSQPVAATCARCGSGACEACAMPRGDGETWCTRCYVARRDRVVRLRWVSTVLLAAVVGAGGVAIFSRQRLAPTLETLRPTPSLSVARPTSFAVELAREALARDPCVPARALELAAALRGISDTAGVVALVKSFEERCGPTPALRWEEAQARVNLGQLDAAQSALDELVADPRDEAVNLPVILHLRGVVNERLRNLEQAAVDLAAAVPVGDSEWRLAVVGETLGRPCDGAFAVTAWETPARAAAQQRLDDVMVRGGCAALAGRGAATITVGAAAEGAVGATAVRWVIDERAPAVILAAPVAARAGIERSGQVVEAVIFGEARRAHRALAPRVAVGGAEAADVGVLIVDEDEIAPGVTAVVGGPWLWRFGADVDRDAGTVRLHPR